MNRLGTRLLIVTLLPFALNACGDDDGDDADAADVTDVSDDSSDTVAHDVVDAGDDESSPDIDALGDPTHDSTDLPDDIDDVRDADAAGPPPCDETIDGENLPPNLTEWAAIDRSESQADVGTPTCDTSVFGVAGAARGRVVASGEFPFTGSEARCRPGDFVLANEHIRVCISNEVAFNQFTYAGGQLVDIASADEPIDAGTEAFEMLAPSTGMRSGGGDDVTLLRDGCDGGTAVVRSAGIDVLMSVVGNLLGNFTADPELKFETEYRLAPGATTLEVVTWVTTDRDVPVRGMEAGDTVLPGNGVTPWAPGDGVIDTPFDVASTLYVASAPDWSYGIYSPTMVLTSFAAGLLKAEVNPLRHTTGRLGRCREATYVRHVTVARDTVRLREAFGDLLEAAVGSEVTFEGPVGETFEDRRYELATTDGESMEVIRLDDDGRARATLPDGDYTATPWGSPLDRAPIPFTVPTEATVELSPPPFGTLVLSINVDDADGVRPSPALVRIGGNTSAEHFVRRGELVEVLPPGEYSLEISRGEAYSLEVVSSVTIVEGEETTVDATLVPLWDTAGWSSGDFHQHQARSVDSDVPNDDRLDSNLAAGLDFIAPSDHDVIDDMKGLVDALDVGDLIHAIVGVEVSPIWGHMNAFPMTFDRSLPAGGAPALSTREPGGREIRRHGAPELASLVRDAGVTLLQMNHPRDSSGMLDSSGYDPVLGPESSTIDSYFWPGPFESIEVVNGTSQMCLIMRDWFSLLRHGWRVAGIGNSDTHSLSSPVGYPRNYVFTEINDPAALTDAVIADAVVDLRVSVSGGVFLDFPGGELPGDEIPVVAGETYSLRVRAQTPEWSSVDTLVVFINGIEVDRMALPPTDASTVVSYDDTLELTFDADAFVVLLAFAATPMSAVTPGRTPFGFTNPLFFDVDGDGWTAPGVSDADDVPMPANIPFCR